MITGFNTDIRHAARVFHVQTEDNGVDVGSIVTLIYVGGEILASRKTSYVDQSDIEEKQISAMMEKQHRLMIGAVKKGKFDGPEIPADPIGEDDITDVSSAPPMMAAAAVSRPAGAGPRPTKSHLAPEVTASTNYQKPGKDGAMPAPPSVARKQPVAAKPRKKAESIQISDRSLDQVIIDYLANESISDHLELTLGSGVEIFAGDQVELRAVASTAVSKEPIVGAEIVVKIISTVEKPTVAFTGKTTGNGSCVIRLKIPDFKEGNAAVIVTGSSPHGNDEIKQLIKRRR